MTMGELAAFLIGAVGFILTIMSILDKGNTLKRAAQEPDALRDARITNLERDVKEIRQYLNNDKQSINELRQSTNMTMRVLFSILGHEITGNEINKLKDIQKELQDFLSGRGITV